MQICPSTVQAVSVGDDHSMALTRDGKVYAWGRNEAGQLGDGTRENRSTPVAVPGLEDVISISAGGSHSMALTTCRHGAKCPAKTICKFDHTNEELTSFKGEYEKAQEQSENDGGWSAPNGNFQARTVCRYLEKCGKGLKCGYLHSPEFTKSLRSWANQVDENETRQIPGLEDVISISAGDRHSMALTRDGKVFAWGSNAYGQLGDGTRENRLTPVAVQGLEDVISISAGGDHSMALTRETTKNGGNFVMMKVADLEALVERLESVTKLVKQFMPN